MQTVDCLGMMAHVEFGTVMLGHMWHRLQNRAIWYQVSGVMQFQSGLARPISRKGHDVAVRRLEQQSHLVLSVVNTLDAFPRDAPHRLLCFVRPRQA